MSLFGNCINRPVDSFIECHLWCLMYFDILHDWSMFRIRVCLRVCASGQVTLPGNSARSLCQVALPGHSYECLSESCSSYKVEVASSFNALIVVPWVGRILGACLLVNEPGTRYVVATLRLVSPCQRARHEVRCGYITSCVSLSSSQARGTLWRH